MNLLLRPPRRHAYSPVRLAFLSGLSDPCSCHLSVQQGRFLAAFRSMEVDVLPTNFPYLDNTPGACAVSLMTASLRNGSQFLSASSASFRRAARRHWDALIAATGRLVVVTLSCGLEILNQCIGGSLPPIPIAVIALGPVARAAPRVPCTIVCGSRDWISRVFFPRCDLMLPGVGHMDYIGHPRVGGLLRLSLCNSTSKSWAPGSIFHSAS